LRYQQLPMEGSATSPNGGSVLAELASVSFTSRNESQTGVTDMRRIAVGRISRMARFTVELQQNRRWRITVRPGRCASVAYVLVFLSLRGLDGTGGRMHNAPPAVRIVHGSEFRRRRSSSHGNDSTYGSI